MNPTTYVAIIGDLVHSKDIINRNQVQQRLRNCLENINQSYTNLASNFMITLGDEFQGLLSTQENILAILDEIEFALHPVQVRFGIGCGSISTDIFSKSSEIDGPAFHYARSMINETKNKNRSITSTLISSDLSPTPTDQLINTIFSLSYVLKEKWSSRQVEIIRTYLQQGKNQYKTADALSIAQSSVYKSLKASNFSTYIQARETINYFLTTPKEDLS